MHQLAFELAAIVALAAAALAAFVGLWQGVPVWSIAFRALVGGGLVFFFTLLGAHLLGRSILQDVAREDLEKKKREEESRARQEAAGGISPQGENASGARTTADTESGARVEAESGREAA